MSKHEDRMSSLGIYNYLSKSASFLSDIDKQIDNSEFKNRLAKAWKETKAKIDAQLLNGLHFSIEEALRYFLCEYNSRNFEHGLDSMPTSFNVMEAFFEHRPDLACFLLRDEKDHMFSMPEYIDYVTSPDIETDPQDILKVTEEGVIYSYSCLNKIEDYVFSLNSKEEFVASGVSIIRHDTEINMLLVAGARDDLNAATVEMRSIENGEVLKKEGNIKPDPNLTREAVPLEGNADFWKHLILTRFDLSDSTQNIRHVMRDCGNGYNIISDDPKIFMTSSGEFIDDAKDFYEEIVKQLDAYEPLFELCKSLLLLPSYYLSYSDSIIPEKHNTELFPHIHKVSWRLKKKYLTAKELINHRMVFVLHRNITDSPNKTNYTSPEFEIERSGFWKQLPASKVGKDKKGRDIHGRTWVNKTLSWIEEDTSRTVITGTDTSSVEIPDGPNKGYIYVMHSGSDKKNIFKVGLTRRTSETRAKEISRGTGVPSKYLVDQEWEVADCVLAEETIHKELEKYRINDKREFFQVPYRVIREVIERNVSLINNSITETG